MQTLKALGLAAVLVPALLPAREPVLTGREVDKIVVSGPVDVLTFGYCWALGMGCNDGATAPAAAPTPAPSAAATPASKAAAPSDADAAVAAQAAALSSLGGGLKVEKGANGELNVTLPEEALQFAVSSAEVSANGKAELKKFAGALKGFKGVKYSVYGYTDSRGAADANRSLSQKRAEAVKDVLVSEGIAATTFTEVKGMGADSPVADNATAEGRAKNRRVVVKLKN